MCSAIDSHSSMDRCARVLRLGPRRHREPTHDRQVVADDLDHLVADLDRDRADVRVSCTPQS